jgi:hypothetical protein
LDWIQQEDFNTEQDVSCCDIPPIIDFKPNNMATVETTMKRYVDMCKEAGQPFPIQNLDQQLYTIAQQVKWATPLRLCHNMKRLVRC